MPPGCPRARSGRGSHDLPRHGPDPLVRPVEERDRPVAAPEEPLRAERLDGDLDRGPNVVRRPIALASAVFSPETFAKTLSNHARARSFASQPASAHPERRLAEVVDDDAQLRKARGDEADVAEVLREDDRNLEDEPELLEQAERFEHRRLA